MQHSAKSDIQLTAVSYHQGVEGQFLIVEEARQHLGVQVPTFVKLPLLEPVEVTRANERVVPQNSEEKQKEDNQLNWLQYNLF